MAKQEKPIKEKVEDLLWWLKARVREQRIDIDEPEIAKVELRPKGMFSEKELKEKEPKAKTFSYNRYVYATMYLYPERVFKNKRSDYDIITYEKGNHITLTLGEKDFNIPMKAFDIFLEPDSPQKQIDLFEKSVKIITNYLEAREQKTENLLKNG